MRLDELAGQPRAYRATAAATRARFRIAPIRATLTGDNIEFGVFDHLDRTGPPLPDYYEDRLKIAEAYDRAGFYAYHLAEHHSTPLGMAPSPNVFLAAVAQRTRRLRFGPLVFALPLHHPLRLIEEICMLDQMSGGRLEIGFGRGASPIELAIYGVDPDEAQDIYSEGVELILKGLTRRRLDFHGKHFDFDDVPMELEPLQKPHPPIWYGVHAPDSAERAAKRNLHVVSLDPPAMARLSIERYRATWRPPHPPARRCQSSASAALSSSPKPTPRRWRWRGAPIRSGTTASRICSACAASRKTIRGPPISTRSMERGQGIAGSPATVTDFLNASLPRRNAITSSASLPLAT